MPTTLVKAGFRSTTGYSGFVDAVMSVFIASAAAARIPPVRAAAAAAAAETADLVARSLDVCVSCVASGDGSSQWGSGGGLGLVKPIA